MVVNSLKPSLWPYSHVLKSWLSPQSPFSMICWSQSITLFPLPEVTSKYHIILEHPIFIALLVLYFFLPPIITKQSAFYHLSLIFFSCCFTLMWHLHLFCIFWVCHGILRVKINHYHIATIMMERLSVCICFCFYLFLNSITYMIGSSIFQNLKLPKSRNQIFPKP